MNSHMDIWLETMIKRWHRDQSIERVLDTKISSFGPENQGYLSQMWRVSLDVILASGERARKRFVVKSKGTSEFAKVWENKYGVFRREVQMYIRVLNKMENLMSQYGDSKGRMWSRLYGKTQDDALIFDDLIAKGYEAPDRRLLLDLEGSLLAVANLARFHGLGMVLLNQGTVNRNEFGIALHLYDDVRFPLMIDPLRDISEAMTNTWGSKWLNTAKKLKGIVDELPQRIDEISNPENSLINLINHGDFKAINLMIKKDWRGRPLKCKILDFQTVTYHSFTYDFHYFMISSVQPCVRHSSYNELVGAYYDALTETLSFYEYPLNRIPSLSQVEEELNRSSLFALIFLPMAAGFLVDRSKKLNFDSSVSETDRDEKTWNSEIYCCKEFKDGYAQDIFNLIEKGTLY